jgi:hypothetical protein
MRRIATKGYDSDAYARVAQEAARAKTQLPEDAVHALEGFQAGTHSEGNWIERDANVQGAVREAMRPVHDVIRRVYPQGEVPLWRAQDATPGGSRELLSWSANPAKAREFTPHIPSFLRSPEIARIEAQYRRTGFATTPDGRKWREQPKGAPDEGYGRVYDRRRGLLTDFGGLRPDEDNAAALARWLREDAEWAIDTARERAAKKVLYQADVPADEVFWVYPNRLSAEFVTRRDPAARGDRRLSLFDDEE